MDMRFPLDYSNAFLTGDVESLELYVGDWREDWHW